MTTSRIYLDASFLIDWYTVEGAEAVEDPLVALFDHGKPLFPINTAVRDLIGSESRLREVAELRHAYLTAVPGEVRLVTSPLAISELVGWKASVSMKQMIVDAAGPHIVQRKGNKEIGNLLKKLVLLASDSAGSSASSQSAMDALSEVTMADSFVVSHACSGIVLEDLTGFSMTVDDALGRAHDLALLQLGAADILHVMAARHLCCTHLASFDQDFARVREILKENFGIALLPSVSEVRRLLLPPNG